LYQSRLGTWVFFLSSFERYFIAQFDRREKIIDLSRDQVHFAPQENEDQKEEEEIDYPENSENIHMRREGTENCLRG
jgi:hypothetical protein